MTFPKKFTAPIILAVVAFVGVGAAYANKLITLTFATLPSVNLDAGTNVINGDPIVMPMGTQGLECIVQTPGSVMNGQYDIVGLNQQASNDGINWITIADAGLNVSDAGPYSAFLTEQPAPFVFQRLLVNGQLQGGTMNCISNFTALP